MKLDVSSGRRAAIVLCLIVGFSGVAAGAQLVVGSIHTSSSDFSGSKTLDNITVQNGNAVLASEKSYKITYIGSSNNLYYSDKDGNNVDTSKAASNPGGMGDPDDDGATEIVYRDTSDNLKYVDAGGSVTDLGVQAYQAGGVADMDGDNDPDVVYKDTSGNLKYVDGSGNVVDTGVDGAGTVGGIGDVDEDGDPDIVFKSSGSNLKYVDGSGNVVDAGIGVGEVGGVGDFDADGDPDMLYDDSSENLKYVDDAGNVGDTTYNGVYSLSHDVVDIDNDGGREVAIRDTSDNLLLVDSSGATSDTGLQIKTLGGIGRFGTSDGKVKASARFVSANHSNLDDVRKGWANLTLDNATASVNWDYYDKDTGTWNDYTTEQYSATGNYTQDLGETSYDKWRADIQFTNESGTTTAQLHDEGVLVLEETTQSTGEISNPVGLPVNSANLPSEGFGFSVFLIGILALLLSIVLAMGNYLAGVMWGLTVMSMIAAGLFGIGLEIMWVTMLGTLALIVMGMIVQWMS